MNDSGDYQFTREPVVNRMGENSFWIQNLVRFGGPNWNHPLHFECEYCHKEITVTLSAPLNIPKFVEEEGKRLAKIDHLRTEHTNKPRRYKTSN